MKVEDKTIDIHLLDKKLLKDLMEVGSGKKRFWGQLAGLNRIANTLKREGLTVTVSYEDSIMLKFGSGARSGLLGTAIEIRDLGKLLRLALM